MNLPLEVDVSHRDSFVHNVTVDRAGMLLEWQFQTKRKSINFGLLFSERRSAVVGGMVQLNSLEPGHIADTAQIAHFTDSTFDHHDHHDIPGIGLLRLNDPHPGGSSVTAGAHGRLSAHGLKKIPALLAKLPAKLHRQTTGHSVASTTPTQSSNSLVMEHSRSSSMTTTTLPASAPIRAAMRRAASASVSGARPPVPSAMSTVAVSAPTAKSAQPSMEHVHVPASAPSTQPDPHVDVHAGSGDDHADGDIETVLPLQRYNASAVAVKGSYLVPRPGNYIFVFDNSFSRSTAKHLTFYVATSDPEAKRDEPKLPEMKGWVLKKKRKTHQGYARRWVELKSGILSYYAAPGKPCRGSISILSAAISIITDQTLIVVDSGTMIYHFKCLSPQDLTIGAYRASNASADNIAVGQDPRQGNVVITHSEPQLTGLGTTSSWFNSEFIDINDRLLTAEDELEDIKITLRKNAAQNSAHAQRLEDVLAKLERVHTTLAACSMRMMSQHQRSDVRTNRMGQSSESLSVSGTSRRFLQPSALNRGQSPSIESSFYFDAEDHSLSSINELGTTRISLFSGSKGNMLAATSPEGMDGLHDTLGPVDMIITPSAAEDEPIVVVADEDDDDSEEERVDLGGQRNDIAPSARTLVKLGDQSTSGATQSTHRRTKLPHDMPTIEVSIVGLLRKNIGKDLSSVSMPVSLNEPLSALQRIAEELEYVELLNRASACACSTDRLKYVAAFAFSAHASNLSRARKPFNPLLGETYEWTSPTGDVCFVAEKVQHHPHVLAAHAESDLFTFDHFGYSKSKFWGKSIELTPVGRKSVRLKAFDEIYTWNRVNVHVTMLGGNKMEFFGDMIVRNTKTGDTCTITFKESGYFSTSNNQVTGVICDGNGKTVCALRGTWSEALYCELEDNKLEVVWQCNSLPAHAADQYGFTTFAMQLNELDPEQTPHLPCTDSRFRPDIRFLEQGNVDAAEAEKNRVEQMQRDRRQALAKEGREWTPQYFERVLGDNGEETYVYRGNYWKQQERRDVKLW